MIVEPMKVETAGTLDAATAKVKEWLRQWDEAPKTYRGHGLTLEAAEILREIQDLADRGELGKARHMAEEESKARIKFLSAINHDIRAPLTTLNLQAQVAKDLIGINDTSTVVEILNDIQKSALSAAGLLNSVLDLTRLELSLDVVQTTTFDVKDLCVNVVRSFRQLAEMKGIYLRLDCDIQNDVICTDRLKLVRLLNNLIDNAIKFTKDGGVTLRVELVGHHFEFTIADTGCGISEPHRDLLFREFFQVNNVERDREKGFGLGLAIAHRLVITLGGIIDVTSESGAGSNFIVRIPSQVKNISG